MSLRPYLGGNNVFKLGNLAKSWSKKRRKKQHKWHDKVSSKNSKVRRIDPATGSVLETIDPRTVIVARKELHKSRRARRKLNKAKRPAIQSSGRLPWED